MSSRAPTRPSTVEGRAESAPRYRELNVTFPDSRFSSNICRGHEAEAAQLLLVVLLSVSVSSFLFLNNRRNMQQAGWRSCHRRCKVWMAFWRRGQCQVVDERILGYDGVVGVAHTASTCCLGSPPGYSFAGYRHVFGGAQRGTERRGTKRDQ